MLIGMSPIAWTVYPGGHPDGRSRGVFFRAGPGPSAGTLPIRVGLSIGFSPGLGIPDQPRRGSSLMTSCVARAVMTRSTTSGSRAENKTGLKSELSMPWTGYRLAQGRYLTSEVRGDGRPEAQGELREHGCDRIGDNVALGHEQVGHQTAPAGGAVP